MPPKTRKRKARDPDPEPVLDQPAAKKKQTKKAVKTKGDSNDNNIAGGMNGDYCVTGTEASSPSFSSITIPDPKGKLIPCQSRGTPKTNSDSTTLIFTHGAGGGLENPATKLFAEGYASANDASITSFQGTMNLSSRVKSFEAVLSHLQAEDPKRRFALGGRSMGARAAVMLAATHEGIKKVVAVSYPLTSPKGDMRDQILRDLPADKEVLFVAGSQDSMCDLEDLRKLMGKMKAKSTLLVVEDADHGMSLGLTRLGLTKGKKEDVIARVRRESGRWAASWVEDSESVADGWRIDYDAVDDKIVVGKKHNADDGSDDVPTPEEVGAKEVDGKEDHWGGSKEEAEQKQGTGSKQKRRRRGSKKPEKKRKG